MAIVIDASDLVRFDRELNGRAKNVEQRTVRVVRHWGQMLETQVKRNASTGHHAPGEPHIPGTGPGPNVATGEYLRSINGETFNEGGRLGHAVGTDAPQAARLEYGFVGADSLGRHYNNPPRPHFGPALDTIEPQFVQAMMELAGHL